MKKSCNDCNYKLKEKTKSKYINPKVYCTKRKCIIPSAGEAQWCKFYNENRSEILKTS